MNPGTNGRAHGLPPEMIPRENALRERAKISPKVGRLEEFLRGCYDVARRVRVLNGRPLHRIEGCALCFAYEVHIGL